MSRVGSGSYCRTASDGISAHGDDRAAVAGHRRSAVVGGDEDHVEGLVGPGIGGDGEAGLPAEVRARLEDRTQAVATAVQRGLVRLD